MREVEEETGLRCALGRELPSTAYDDAKGRPKVVRYWVMEVVGGALRFEHEVDEARWLPAGEAAALLTYERDVDVLRDALWSGERQAASPHSAAGPTMRAHPDDTPRGGAMSKVLILAGDAAEDLETMFIKYRLAEAGYEPHVAAPTIAPDQARRPRLRAGLGHLRRAARADVPGRRRLRRRRPGRVRGARDPRRPRARVHPGRPGRVRASSGTSSPRRSPSARSATARRCRPRSASCAGAGAPPSARSRPTSRWPAASTSTVPRSSTGTWSRAAAGATSPSGRGRSSSCSTGRR